MHLHEYDAQGWLVGWHEDEARPNSTPVAPTVPPSHARWDGTQWVADPSRQNARFTADADTVIKSEQAKQSLRSFDPLTSTDADVRVAIAALIHLNLSSIT